MSNHDNKKVTDGALQVLNNGCNKTSNSCMLESRWSTSYNRKTMSKKEKFKSSRKM